MIRNCLKSEGICHESKGDRINWTN